MILSLAMLVSLLTCLCGLTASAAGTTPDLVEFKGTDWTCMKYTKGWSTIQAGNYKFTMDCKIVSGVPWIQVGADETGAALSAQSNYTATYDDVNFKYIITFTMDSSWSGNLGAMVGNYGTGGRVGNCTGDAVFYCANPTLYLLDGSGNPTGSSLINTFASDYYSTSRTGNKWNRRNFSSSTATCTSPVPSGFFDPVAEPEPVVPDYVHFEEYRNNYSRWLYRAPYKTQAAGNYRFTMDCKIFSGTPTINVGSADNGGNTFTPTAAFTNYTATYDAENYKYIITFTFESAFTGSDRIGVCVGNYGTSGNFVCANPELYLLDGSGDPTGDNLINTFASDYYWSSGSKSQLWERTGNYTVKTLPDHYFDNESTNNYAAHFTSGSDNYQVLAYKDNCVYVNANTVYRLKIDINNFGSAEPSVQVRTGSDIGTSYTGTLISTDGFERVYEFTVTSAGAGIGMFIGNYGKGTDLDFAFRNPRLYTYKNSTYGTTNILVPFGANNYEQRDWKGSRSNANNGKWTPINCSSSLFSTGADDGGYFPDAIEDTGTPKMANVYHGFSYRVFIYNDTSVALTKGQTYTFTIDQKVASGSPTVNIYDATGGSNSNINNSDYTSSYNDTVSGNKRTITFTMAKTVTTLRIRVGNYSDATDVAASFANPMLVKAGTTNNLIAGFTSDNFTTTGNTNRKWYIANQQSGNNVITHDIQNIPDGYFNDAAQKNMYYISEVTTAYQGLEYNAKLEPDTTYNLEFDWRTYSGAYPKVAITTYNGSDWPSATQTALSNNTMDGIYTALSSNRLPATVVYKSYGHYAVSFTTPSDLSADGYRNVNIMFANYIMDDDYYHYGRGGMYLGNFSLKKAGESGNTILNGGLEIAKTGDVNQSDTGKFAGFVMGIAKNNGSRDLYANRRVLPQPDEFFTEAGSDAQKLVKINGGNFDYFRQNVLLEPGKQYCLFYKYTFVNAESGIYVQHLTEDGDDADSDADVINATYTITNDLNSTKYLVFTVPSNALTAVKANTYISFFIGRNAPDAGFYFTDVNLRPWTGTYYTGPNLINNGGFYFGEERKAENNTAITGLASSERDQRDTGAIELNGWKVYGYYTSNQNIEVINLTDGFFSEYIELAFRLPLLRKILIGFEARTYHPYEDINNDESFNLKDYVHTKIAWLEAGGTATTTAAEEFKNTYVYGDNTTNLAGMDINLFGNKTRPTGTVYYVDADNGNDSNSGTSPSSAWKTLNKVNTASISSGSAVLFKCGCVWRAKTNECTSTDPNKGVLRCKNGVTYGSYGSGTKPVIVGSYYNYASRTWTSAGTNIWKTNINLSGNYHGNDVGIIVYNYGSLIGKMTLKKADLANEGDFWCREPNGTDGGDGSVYVYCTENPANHWRSIEIGQKRHLCDLADNVTINNICFKYGGLHGLTGSNLSAVCISNCEIAYIGGAYNSSRLGNGVELALTAANCRVKNCYVRECYDAGLTFQCWTGTGSFQSINFSNNLIENCNYSIEYFVNNASDKMKDIYIMNNICRGAGYGWSYDERVGYGKNEDDIGCYRTAHIRCTARGDLHYTNLSEFYIQNNIFDCSKGALIHWWWNANGSESPFDYDGLHISGNTFYQSANSDDRILQFRDESAIYGCSTYSVREALKKFEGTETPTHLNDSKFLVSERVISTY